MDKRTDDARVLATLLVALGQALEKNLGMSAAAVMKQAGNLAAESLVPGTAPVAAADDPWPAVVAELAGAGLFGPVGVGSRTGAEATIELPKDRLAECCADLGGKVAPKVLDSLCCGVVEHCVRRVAGLRCRVEIGDRDPATGNRLAHIRLYE